MRITKPGRKQTDKLSDILSDIGLVSLASVVLPAMFDKYDLIRVLLGIAVSLIFWLSSYRLKK